MAEANKKLLEATHYYNEVLNKTQIITAEEETWADRMSVGFQPNTSKQQAFVINANRQAAQPVMQSILQPPATRQTIQPITQPILRPPVILQNPQWVQNARQPTLAHQSIQTARQQPTQCQHYVQGPPPAHQYWQKQQRPEWNEYPRHVNASSGQLYQQAVHENQGHILYQQGNFPGQSYQGQPSGFNERDGQRQAPRTELENLLHLLTESNRGASRNRMRLPEIQLKPFDGNIKLYKSFKEGFNSIINDTDTTPIQRLTYLKSKLMVPALVELETLNLTEGNYEFAWHLLDKRFDNRRIVIEINMEALLQPKPLVNNNPESYLQLLQTFD